MAGTNYHQMFNIFISSPGDVSAERQICEDVISSIGISLRDTLGYHLECKRWEHLAPVIPPPLKTIQDVIMEEIDKSQIFILVLFKRYGERDPRYKISHTEMEIARALRLLKKGKNLMFLSYFKEIPPNPDRGDQEKSILELKEKLQKEKVWFREFSGLEDFRTKLTHDLYNCILRRFGASTRKQAAWRKFWNLGMVEGQTRPRLAIIYPTMDKKLFADDNNKIWLKRLMPVIPFEDFSAVEFIERTLRNINFTEFKTYTAARLPEDWNDMNRVWICLPRNNPGDEQLKKHRRGIKFAIEAEKDVYHIKWMPRQGSVPIIVNSPLAAYLREQRNDIEDPAWGPKHGRIVARDFAILARLSVESRVKESGKLKDYFFAGIRGLGTWGAGWFLLNKCEAFQKLDENEDANIQLLLEVTFKDEEIFDVRDVSNQPQSYFDAENSEGVIHENIRLYNQKRS